jgi:transposase
VVGFACTKVEADMTVAITRTEHTATALRRHAACSVDASVARRLLALALILDGCKREDAARAAGMNRQTLRDWVHRYNADGLAGLSDRHGGGAPSRLSPEQEAEVADWIRRGPDVAVDGVVRWRCVDIQARLAREWGVALHERSVGKLLHRLRFARVSTRPRHPKADVVAQASFGPSSSPL